MDASVDDGLSLPSVRRKKEETVTMDRTMRCCCCLREVLPMPLRLLSLLDVLIIVMVLAFLVVDNVIELMRW